MDQDHRSYFGREKKASRSTVIELIRFMRERRKWWLAPIIAAVLIIGALALLAGTGAAPFIYTLF